MITFNQNLGSSNNTNNTLNPDIACAYFQNTEGLILLSQLPMNHPDADQIKIFDATASIHNILESSKYC